MAKREYCMKHPAIAYYSGLNGLEIHGIEYDIDDYIYCVSGAWGGGASTNVSGSQAILTWYSAPASAEISVQVQGAEGRIGQRLPVQGQAEHLGFRAAAVPAADISAHAFSSSVTGRRPAGFNAPLSTSAAISKLLRVYS